MRSSNRDIDLKTPYPGRLAYILRNAPALEEYRWLKEKYTFKVEIDRVRCIIKEIQIEVVDDIDIPIVNDPVDIRGIVQAIIRDHPDAITFTSINLTEEDTAKLEMYLTSRGYKYTIDTSTLKIKR